MREYKFRAWVVDEFMDDGNTPKTFKMHSWDNYFFYDTSAVTGWSGEFPHREDPCVTLMQFTGVQDSEGTDIYEGDIIKNSVQTDSIVRWSVRSNGWILLTRDTALIYGGLTPAINGRVIGNIFENPELGYG